MDGKELIEKNLKVTQRPKNLTLILGSNGDSVEMTGRTTNLNIFSSALSVTKMKNLTEAGVTQCGAPGDVLSWEEAEWTLHSRARIIEVERELEGPCRRQSKMQVYPMLGYQEQSTCMELCQKFGGVSPSVKTFQGWEYLYKEAQHISPDPKKLPNYVWLSATEGNNNLERQENWPKEIEAQEGKWRDYYTGDELANFTKPWFSSNGDAEEGNHSNCIFYSPQRFPKESWQEWQCQAENYGCPCSFDNLPMLRLRGACLGSDIEQIRYTPIQLPSDPSDVFLVGAQSSKMRFEKDLNQWVLRSPFRNVTATSTATQVSFAQRWKKRTK